MDINLLKKNASAKKFSGGHVIIREGDKMGDEMYVIVEGEVCVFRNYGKKNEKKIATLGAGNFFGEMSLFLHRERTSTAIANGDVVLLVVDRVTAFGFFETQPQISYSLIKTLCMRLDRTNKILYNGDTTLDAAEVLFGEDVVPPAEEKLPAPPAAPAPAEAKPPAGLISDTPPPGFISDTPPPGFDVNAEPSSSLTHVPEGLFPEGHKIYDLKPLPPHDELIYKKTFKCPICEHTFQALSVRTTRLKLIRRDRDFRSHFENIDTAYYEIITCPECYFSNFESGYNQPVIARFKENIGEITRYKHILGIDIVGDRTINNVFAGYLLALKGAPLFYKSYEMLAAKIWLRLTWLYDDCRDKELVRLSTSKAHKAYLLAFEKTDAAPEALQQLCVLIGELSLMVRDMPNAKMYFVKARGYKNLSKVLADQASDGIETIRKIESGQIKF
ncbi:MAG: DUF2225 domain-containing protein [Defluviitaleaceae bacterium]|nr:DUF2225 domain-containing protein [Defluviitaleaceae bacterium]